MLAPTTTDNPNMPRLNYQHGLAAERPNQTVMEPHPARPRNIQAPNDPTRPTTALPEKVRDTPTTVRFHPLLPTLLV